VLQHPRGANLGAQDVTPAGEGCYVTATLNNRRFYGVLIDQVALKSASLLHFQEEASGLDLNRRMLALSQQQQRQDGETVDDRDFNGVGNDRKRVADDENAHDATGGRHNAAQKRQRSGDGEPDCVSSTDEIHHHPVHAGSCHQVQKFRYVKGVGLNNDYRELLATFAHVAAAGEDDPSLMRKIEAACNAGGDYVNSYYYQYEVRLT
jgi:hypothetical protein